MEHRVGIVLVEVIVVWAVCITTVEVAVRPAGFGTRKSDVAASRASPVAAPCSTSVEVGDKCITIHPAVSAVTAMLVDKLTIGHLRTDRIREAHPFVAPSPVGLPDVDQ